MRKQQRMSDLSLVSADELERYSTGDFRYELVEGRVVRMSPVGFEHGRIVARMIALLRRHVDERQLGEVITEVGFKLASNPDTVRAPDIAFVRTERIPVPAPRGFLMFSPDVAIEVLSPADRPADVLTKVDEYLDHAVPLVVVIDPEQRIATSYRRLMTPVVVRHENDVITLGDVLPEFTLRLRNLF